MTDHIATHVFGKGLQPKTTKWLRASVIVGCICVLAVLAWRFARPLSLLLIGLAANTVLEYHKVFTSRAPVDIEVVSFTTAYLSATYGLGWGLPMALFAPLIAHAGINYFGDATIVKTVAALSVAVAASVFGHTTIGIFCAILVGMAVQYCIFIFILGRNPVTNFIARLTTIAFSAYLIVLLL